MSYDLYFWKAGLIEEPQAGDLAERLAEHESDDVPPDRGVLAFRAEILARWPELADHIEPWHHDLDWRQPAGPTNLADRFVILTLSYSWPFTAELLNMAKHHDVIH